MRFAALLLPPALLCATSAAGQVQPLPGTTAAQRDADRLADAVRQLGRNPRDLSALVEAGDLSFRVGDATAAAAFYKRAEAIDPRNGRVKAGIARILVNGEHPGEALRFFDLAQRYGAALPDYAADRGFAYDLIGEQERAQRDYRVALSRGEDEEVRRRYALSLGISGRQDEALAQIDTLLRQSDRGAWRARAFILAMGGDVAGANRIATSMMPRGMAAGLDAFFRRLPTLSPVDRAFAVHFGEVTPTPARVADARLTPPLPALGADPTAPRTSAPVQVAAAAPTEDRRTRRAREREARRAAALASAQRSSAATSPWGVARGAPNPRTAAAQPATPTQVASASPAPRPTPAPAPAPAPAASPTPSVTGTQLASTSPVPAPVQATRALTSATPAPAVQPSASSPVPQPAASSPLPAPVVATPTAVTPTPPAASPAASTASQAVAAAALTAATPAPISPALTAATPAPAAPTQPAPVVPTPAPAVTPPASPLPSSSPTTVASTSIAPQVAATPASAAPTPVPPRMGEDTILARIVAGLSIPASELGVPPMPGAAPPPVPVEPAAPVATTVPLEQAAAKAERNVAADDDKRALLAAARTAERRAAKEADEAKPATTAARKGKAAADAELKASDKKAPDKKVADSKRAGKKAAEAKAEKKREPAEPARIWVQVAGGANEKDLPRAWKDVQAKTPALAGRQAYSTPLRATNRVVTGPFKTEAEARAMVNKLAKQGLSAFTFSSEAGQKMTKLDGK